jgi:hypothetical protein
MPNSDPFIRIWHFSSFFSIGKLSRFVSARVIKAHFTSFRTLSLVLYILFSHLQLISYVSYSVKTPTTNILRSGLKFRVHIYSLCWIEGNYFPKKINTRNKKRQVETQSRFQSKRQKSMSLPTSKFKPLMQPHRFHATKAKVLQGAGTRKLPLFHSSPSHSNQVNLKPGY